MGRISGPENPWFALLIVPLALAIGLVWGAYFDDSAYVTFRYARDLAAGRGLTYNLVAGPALSKVEGGQTPLRSPLYVLALALPAWLGMPLPQVGLVLSALGWGAAAVAVYSAGRAMRRPVAAVVSATLVAFNPVVVSTLGTEISWTVAWAWLAIAASIGKRWNVQIVALALMLCTYFDLSTLALATLLFVIQWIERRRFPLRLGLTTRRTLWVGLLWGGWVVTSILSGGAAAEATIVTLGLFLAGLGIDWAIEWIETQNIVRLDRFTLAVSLALVAGLPLGMAQVSSLFQRYQLRPVVRQELEQRAGDWLRAHSEPTATVFASERVGYLADRPTIPWDGSESDQVALANLLRTLNEDPPEYNVSFKSIAWDHLMRTNWFRDNYTPLEKFESPYDGASVFTIWGYRFNRFDWGDRRSLNVHLPGEVDLVGYKYWPDRVQPGDAVYVTLFLRATQPITDPFRIVMGVISPRDGVNWAQRDVVISHASALVGWWQTGEAIAERFVLTTTSDIPVGAYRMNVSIAALDSAALLPIYQDDDTSPLDRITLGDVVVPWRGELDLDKVKPLDANFGHQIGLLGFDAPDSPAPGAGFDVTLYWEARRPPEDDYVVFVHLLDAEGQIVASHDGPPVDGRYATGAWLPGEVVPDVHHLALDPNVRGGTYRLQVGMYRWPGMERLPIWDSQGVEQVDCVMVLQSVTIE